MGELNVCFQIDTDNRENFPSLIAFQAFRKQRDSFYEIFRIWQEKHSVPGFQFQIALAGKIWTMLTMHNDAINYYHFARLFKSQLLISCIQNEQQVDVDDESLSFLKALKNVNPKKLTQLQKRLVTPLPSTNQVTGPTFPGEQEFFKDFILFAFNPSFYVHLENCLVHEILELNDTQFAGSEIEDSDTTVDEQTQKNFITCLSSLRLLAKVLGFLVSLPYRSESSYQYHIETQMEVRSRVLPLINLHLCLHNAIVLGKLSLTVPWIVKYLAMMDTVTLRLPYYKQVLELLYYIYKTANQSDISKLDSAISQKTALLLKSTLGWLFELPNFPKDFCTAWQEAYKTKKTNGLKQLDKHYVQKSILLGESIVPASSGKCSLDKLDIINDRVIRTCCPSMVNVISTQNSNKNQNNCNTNKHITPVSSQLHKGGTARSKHLELQLEEAFFHGQPASTRKTVDFVSERVASTCVKHICNTLLTTARETNLNNFRKILEKNQATSLPEEMDEESSPDIKKLTELLEADLNALASSMSKELKEKCEAEMPELCKARVTKSIESLLAEDSVTPVKEMCIKIAMRLAMERIHQWIQSHIVGGTLFMKDMELELNRFVRNNCPVHSVQERKHNPEVDSPTTVINELRAMIWELLDNNGANLTITTILNILDKLYRTLHERADLLVGPERLLYSLSIDFCLFLAAHRMDLFTLKVHKKLIRVWSLSNWEALEKDSPLHRILSPRNVMLLAQPEKDEVWPVFGKFIKKLIEKKILDVDILCDQCVALFRQDWPVPILKHLSKCLTEAIADYKASDESAEKVKYLLGWIAETYHEIEFPDDYSPID